MALGNYLRQIRNERQLSLRDVQRLAKENRLGAELSSGYLSLLERNEVREPSPRVLHALASIYEVDYIDLMRQANYIHDDDRLKEGQRVPVVFRGASQLSKEQRNLIQRMIDFELNDTLGRRGQRKTESTDG